VLLLFFFKPMDDTTLSDTLENLLSHCNGIGMTAHTKQRRVKLLLWLATYANQWNYVELARLALEADAGGFIVSDTQCLTSRFSRLINGWTKDPCLIDYYARKCRFINITSTAGEDNKDNNDDFSSYKIDFPEPQPFMDPEVPNHAWAWELTKDHPQYAHAKEMEQIARQQRDASMPEWEKQYNAHKKSNSLEVNNTAAFGLTSSWCVHTDGSRGLTFRLSEEIVSNIKRGLDDAEMLVFYISLSRIVENVISALAHSDLNLLLILPLHYLIIEYYLGHVFYPRELQSFDDERDKGRHESSLFGTMTQDVRDMAIARSQPTR
jgi:hypothetical protein